MREIPADVIATLSAIDYMLAFFLFKERQVKEAQKWVGKRILMNDETQANDLPSQLPNQLPKLLIATHNAGKIREYKHLLADLPLEVTWLDAEGISFEADETGDTCAENAIQKAIAYAQASGLWTWADDSGLEVDALGGKPGVHAARWAGVGAPQQARNEKLLREIAPFPPDQRQAHFLCVVAIAIPRTNAEMEVHTVEGRLDGMITGQPRGEHGFGYDPLFLLPAKGVTLAELESVEKNRISHRAQAAAKARTLLHSLLENR